MPVHKSGKKTRKYGRNTAKGGAYKLSRKREKNKKRKLLKHTGDNLNDKVAFQALKRI